MVQREFFWGKMGSSHYIMKKNYIKLPYFEDTFQEFTKIWKDS